MGEWQDRLFQQLEEMMNVAKLQKGDVFVLGCSTSEVVGGVIGKHSNAEVGEHIVETVRTFLQAREIELAVQCCEHLNRALVVERSVAERYQWECVNVVPSLHAGGACATAAYQQLKDAVVIEHIQAQAGMDIGDTSIGMHIKHVQVPIRLTVRELGHAHVTALYSRPKYIGGPRAMYE